MRVDTAQLEQERTRMEGYSPERLQATIDEVEGKLNTVFDEARSWTCRAWRAWTARRPTK